VQDPRALAALTAERRKTADGVGVHSRAPLLEHHLRQYTRFFIHEA